MSNGELKPEIIEDPSAGGSSEDPRRRDERFPPPPPPPIQEPGSSIAATMIINQGTNKPSCAACKFQRRKCTKDCLLAPYFPADKPKTFSNAHRLFGVSNMVRILKRVQPDERDEAMKSIIFESDMRERYPAYGCYGIVLHYQHRISNLLKELHYVQTLLAHYRQLQQDQPQQQQNGHSNKLPLFPMDQYSMSSLPSTSEAVIPPHNRIYPGAESYLFNGNVGGFIESNKNNWVNNFPYSDDVMMGNVGPNLDDGGKFDSLVPMDYQSHDQELDIPIAMNSNTVNENNVMDAKSSEIGSLGVVQDLADDNYDYNEDDDDDMPPLDE